MALRERELSGRRPAVDVSMADGALSWLAMVAARMLADRATPARGGLELAGGLACYRPYRCADGYVTLGALEPKFWQAFCHGVGREDLIARHLGRPSGAADTQREGSRRSSRRARATSGRAVRPGRARLLPRAGARPRRGARLGARARARDGRRDRPARRRAPGAAARRPDQALAHARRPGPRAGPALGQDTRVVLEGLDYSAEEIDGMLEAGAVAGPAGDSMSGSFMG